MKRQVEVFTAGCPLCEPVVEMVKEIACSDCEISIYNTVELCEDKVCLDKMKSYQVSKVPAVAVDGRLLSCCQDQEITRQALVESGIGQPLN